MFAFAPVQLVYFKSLFHVQIRILKFVAASRESRSQPKVDPINIDSQSVDPQGVDAQSADPTEVRDLSGLMSVPERPSELTP